MAATTLGSTLSVTVAVKVATERLLTTEVVIAALEIEIIN
jgi:hypothetical protein